MENRFLAFWAGMVISYVAIGFSARGTRRITQAEEDRDPADDLHVSPLVRHFRESPGVGHAMIPPFSPNRPNELFSQPFP